METDDQYLRNIYTNPSHPASFTGPEKLKQVVDREGIRDISRKKIRSFLLKQDSYTVNRPVRHAFKRNHVVTRGISDLLDVDLSDFSRISKYNDGVTFLLTSIDVFSRVAFVRPLKNKKSDTVLKALTDILQESGQVRVIRTDSGSEFKNRKMSKFLTENNIKHVFAAPPIKAGYVERLNLTLKRSIYTYLYSNNTFRYIDQLQYIVRAYNRRPHRSLGNISPIEVNKTNEATLFNDMYINRPYRKILKQPLPPKIKKKKMSVPVSRYKFKVGQLVRISHSRRTFERSFDQKFTEEIFKVTHRLRKDNIPLYLLKDFNGESVKGSFYTSELQAVSKSRDDHFKIESIIKHRGKGQNHQVLVRWRGYPSTFDSWLPYSSIKDI
jgi:transposase InsO family protein